MRDNRIRTALQALGGRGTTQDITAALRTQPENVSAQLAGMCQRGDVRKAGERIVKARRWHFGAVRATATVWELIK